MSEANQQRKVLALKYRPKRFEDLVGQGTISQTLSLALDSDRLSHAYLFSGLRGSGKTSTARIMAKALLCSNGPTSQPCEVCENCLSANSNRHLDIIEMDAASNRGIDDIKDLIEHTKYKPSSARFKVFIIDEVHMLTTQAFNALLKTLEEPPGFVKFILATTDPLKLPATILSRTQHFRFKRIGNKDVIHHLTHILNEEGVEYEMDALEIITRSGQGSLRDTLTLLDQAIIFAKGKVTTAAVVDMLGLIDPKFLDQIFDTVLSNGDTNSIVTALEEYEASAVCDEMTIYLKNKMFARDPKFDLLIFDRFFRIIGDAKHLLSINSDPTFVLILMLSKMIEATHLKTINEIINEVETAEIKELSQAQASHMTEAISEKTVLEHSHEASTQVVSQEAQEIYHQEPAQQPAVQEVQTPVEEPAQQAPVQEVAAPAETVPEQATLEPVAQPVVQEQAQMEPQMSHEPTQIAQEEQTQIVNDPVVQDVAQDLMMNAVETVTYDHPNPFDPVPTQMAAEASPVQEPAEVLNQPEQSPKVQSANTQESQHVEAVQDVAHQSVEPSQAPIEEPVVQAVEPTAQAAVAPIEETPVQEAPVQQEAPLQQETAVQQEAPVQAQASLNPAVETSQAEEHDPHKEKFELVINRIYDRDIELGEAFEDNFIYKSFDGKTLIMTSFAEGEARKLLFKHYGLIKTFIYDLFGSNIEIEFVKEEKPKEEPRFV